jgi:hypothetical protein
MTKTLPGRFWRSVTFLVRLDMAASITVTVALLAWMMWH